VFISGTMLTSDSSTLAHVAQNLSLLWLSVVLLPFDTFLLFLAYVARRVFRVPVPKAQSNATRKTVLVTGVGMTKGLFLARAFYLEGHRVIGADFEPNGALVCGRVSKSLSAFYRLTKPNEQSGSEPYVSGLLHVIRKEKVDLWVSCSGVASAVEDGEAKEIIERGSSCKAIQFDVPTTEKLHEKHSFIENTASLGLTVPETHVVTDRESVQRILDAAEGKRFIMKSIGLDDSSRGDMTLLPRPTAAETSKHLSRIRVSHKSPWIVQQYIQGREYCTHSLVIRGVVKVFVACPSLELLMHYETLPEASPLSRAMLAFTTKYASSSGADFTGHLSFDFLVEDSDRTLTDPSKITLYPIECNPRAHTAVCLFTGTPGMVPAYLSLLSPPSYADAAKEPNDVKLVTPVRPRDKYYWIGHDLVSFVVLPMLSVLGGHGSASDVVDGVKEFADHVLFWRDGTFEIWDPLPCWWLYHVYWPMKFVDSLLGRKWWSRVNVSTTKMFGC